MFSRKTNGRSAHLLKMQGCPSYVPALLEAMQLRNANATLLKKLTDDEWRELLQFADLAHLALPLFDRCKDSMPEWVAARLSQNISDNKCRIKNVRSAYVEIRYALLNAGIEHIVVKGFAQHPEFIEKQELRFQSDIDLYCPKEMISKACEALIDIGYLPDRTLDGFPSDHLPTMIRNTEWTWRGNMYDPEMPPSIDLHFCLWNEAETHIAIKDVERFWEQRVMSKQGKDSFPALNLTDNLGFCALHVLRDLFRGDWIIHHVYELAWFLHHRAKDEDFWTDWISSHGERLRSFEMISFWLAENWFQCDLSPILRNEMSRLLPMSEAWLHRFSSFPLRGMFRPNKVGIWLHLRLLPSMSDKWTVLRYGLLPTRIPALRAPGQNTTKSRKIRRFWPKQPHIRYIFHIVFRIAFHLRLLGPTLYQGVRLWPH